MVQDNTVAREISDLMVEFGSRLDASIKRVQDACSAEEFQAYRRAVGKIMGDMLVEVMNPLYSEHPELKPNELK